MTLIFLLEEPSMKVVLDILLPQILPSDVVFKTIPHSGKSDLKRSIPRKLKAWRQPDTKFVILQDQDSADCVQLKQEILELTRSSGREVLVRIVCKELESWYFGDLDAVSRAYGKDITGLLSKARFRVPDQIENPKAELRKIFPKRQQLDGARRIAINMEIEKNTSESFSFFISGVKRLIE